jgi:pantetheine-phosphate adenylyltransferase/8-oxo-dGTP diphosphatase
MRTKAVYAGTFDVLTQGHIWVINAAADIFDELVVAIGVNPSKKCTFSLEKRLEMLRNCVMQRPASFSNKYLIYYAQEIGVTHIVRGMRNVEDFEFERLMLNINSDIQGGSNIKTVYFVPPRELAETSSSAVKALCGPEGWEEVVSKMVPPCVLEELKTWKESRI